MARVGDNNGTPVVASLEDAHTMAHGRIEAISTEAFTMGCQLELLEAEALKLTVGERAALAQLLLKSLDEDAEINEACAVEIERRIAGCVTRMSGDV
jgi:hypothetical protein